MLNYLKESFASINELYSAQKEIHKHRGKAAFYTMKSIFIVKYNNICYGLYKSILTKMGILEYIGHDIYKIDLYINKKRYIFFSKESISSPSFIMNIKREENGEDITEEVLAIDRGKNSLIDITPNDLGYSSLILETMFDNDIIIEYDKPIELKI